MAGCFMKFGEIGGCTLTLNNVVIDATKDDSDAAGTKVAVSVTPQDHLPGTLIATNVEFIVKGEGESSAKLTEDAFAVQVSASHAAPAKIVLKGCKADCVGGNNTSPAENQRGYVLAMNSPVTSDSSIGCKKNNEGMFDFFTVSGIDDHERAPWIVPAEGMRWRDQGSDPANKFYSDADDEWKQITG